MDYIVIEGVPPYDGRWPFDLEGQELTTREWGWVKRFSGYLPLTIDKGLSDPELIVVWACVALTRAQKATPAEVPQLFERLIDAPYGSTFTLETDTVEEVEESRPPPSSSSGSDDSSGDGSRSSSETLVLPPNRSGTPGSASLASGPRRLASEHRAS